MSIQSAKGKKDFRTNWIPAYRLSLGLHWIRNGSALMRLPDLAIPNVCDSCIIMRQSRSCLGEPHLVSIQNSRRKLTLVLNQLLNHDLVFL